MIRWYRKTLIHLAREPLHKTEVNILINELIELDRVGKLDLLWGRMPDISERYDLELQLTGSYFLGLVQIVKSSSVSWSPSSIHAHDGFRIDFSLRGSSHPLEINIAPLSHSISSGDFLKLKCLSIPYSDAMSFSVCH